MRIYRITGLLLLAGCGWGEERCVLPAPPVLQYALQLLDARTGQDVFGPGSGFSPDSVRFFYLTAAGSPVPQQLPVRRLAGGGLQIGPLQPGAGATTQSVIVPPSPERSASYLDLLVRLNRQDTDTVTVVAQTEFRGGIECGRSVTTKLQFYYNGRLNATYSLLAPDTLREFMVPASVLVQLRKLR